MNAWKNLITKSRRVLTITGHERPGALTRGTGHQARENRTRLSSEEEWNEIRDIRIQIIMDYFSEGSVDLLTSAASLVPSGTVFGSSAPSILSWG